VDERVLTALLRRYASVQAVPGAALGILQDGEFDAACRPRMVYDGCDRSRESFRPRLLGDCPAPGDERAVAPRSWENRPVRMAVNGTRLWFDVDGAAVVVEGSELRRRPTVVLIHGGPGSYDHGYLKPDFGRLAQHAQVVYLDLRGHGHSEWGRTGDWTFEACADDIHAFCCALGIERPIVLGHSMGAPIVLLYGARHPGQAAGLVVQSGFARWDPARMVEAFRRIAGGYVADIARRSYAGEKVPDDDWAQVFPAFGPHRPDQAREQHTPQNLELNAHGMDLVRGLDIVDQLVDIDVPTLVSVGDVDPVTPVAAAEEIVRALPDGIGELDIVGGGGHFTWLDAPERYWPPLIEFVERVAGRDRSDVLATPPD
jgi:proline iminopeptidase